MARSMGRQIRRWQEQGIMPSSINEGQIKGDAITIIRTWWQERRAARKQGGIFAPAKPKATHRRSKNRRKAVAAVSDKKK